MPRRLVWLSAAPVASPAVTLVTLPSHNDVVLLQQFTPFPVSDLCCLLCRVDDIGEKNCCQNSIRLGAMTNPREKFLDLIEQRVRISHVWGMIRSGQLN